MDKSNTHAPDAAGMSPLKQCLLFAFLFISILPLPYWPVINLHDTGAEGAIEYWTLHHYQYGKEIVQNVGPLGFLTYTKLYTGFLDAPKFALNLFLTALYILLILSMAKRLKERIWRWSLIAVVALFSTTWFEDPGYLNADTKLDLLMLLMAYRLFETGNRYWVICLAVTAALLSLAKGVLLHTAPMVVLLAALNFVLSGRKNLGLLAVAAYGVALVFFWWLCGQELGNLPTFLAVMLGLKQGYASGYNDSSFLFEGVSLRVAGIGTVLLAASAILFKHVFRLKADSLAGNILKLSTAGIEMLILFMSFKHGFVRADGHALGFFCFTIIAGTFFFCWQPPSTTLRKLPAAAPRALLFLACLTGIILCSARMQYFPEGDSCPDSIKYCPEIVRNISAVFNAPHYVSDLESRLAASVTNLQMPATRKLVGNAGLGYFGYLPARMLYNDFNYRPMPNTISFTGWSHQSMENDAAFFRDDAVAPPFLLYRQGTIDNRMSAQDDALAQLEVLRHYDPVIDNAILADTKENLLLKRRSVPGKMERIPLNPETEFPLNRWIDVPRHGADPVALKLRMADSVFSLAVRTLYKPSEYAIEYVLSNGTVQSRKFLPRMAEEGLLIAPLIDNNRDLLMAYLDKEYERYLADRSLLLSRILKFRILCKHMEMTCADHFGVTFETIEGLDLGRVRGVSLGQ